MKQATAAAPAQAPTLNDGAESLAKGSRVWVLAAPTSSTGSSGRGMHSSASSGALANAGSIAAQNTWTPGELRGLSTDDGTGQVALDDGRQLTVELHKIVPANPKLQEGIPDLTHLSYLNEPGITYNLETRYAADEIYTFAGPVLIALNPCKPLPLYTTEMATKYRAGARDVVASSKLPPHIYLVAANAFRRMLREKCNQSLIVNGESGAGKTETTKKAMQYFATLAGGTGVEGQVLETNPILEAFGNAKTLRNHNSSRFGKLIQMHFNSSHHICGARIKTYLLEKSRVVHQLKGERSFHIFYQMLRGLKDSTKRAQLHLPPPNKDAPLAFKCLAQSGCWELEGVDDAEDFSIVCSALKDVGVTEDMLDALMRLLAGVLWLSNLEFVHDEADRNGETYVLAQNPALDACSDLLGVGGTALSLALTRKRIVTPSETITKILNLEECLDCRDALAKALYAAAFDWIVEAINKKLDNMPASRQNAASGGGLSISILDIYGFEAFNTNSFEQLCINYANERLQQQFTRHHVRGEQQEYENEGIDWTKVEFVDNQQCVDVIEQAPPKGLGVLAVLDAQCRFPKSTDMTFVETLKEALSSHPHFSSNPRAPREFRVLHYAGTVPYDCAGFLDKNKDTLNSDLMELMAAAQQEASLVPELGRSVKEDCEANTRRGGQSVGSRFSQQLRELIQELDATGLHFVRCIKPNDKLLPGQFEAPMILHQLRCCGVLEVARIARAGFPTRYAHQAFAERYSILLPPDEQSTLLEAAAGLDSGKRSLQGNALEACRKLVDKFGLSSSQFQVGRTKIFFRPGVLGFVEDKWAAMQTGTLVIQASWRMYLQRRCYLAVRTAALQVQSAWRARGVWLQFLQLRRELAAAHVLQAAWRGYHARSRYLATLQAARTLQDAWRLLVVRRELMGRITKMRQREAAAKAEQEQFTSLRMQYGCEMEEVQTALAFWRAKGMSSASSSQEPSSARAADSPLSSTHTAAPSPSHSALPHQQLPHHHLNDGAHQAQPHAHAHGPSVAPVRTSQQYETSTPGSAHSTAANSAAATAAAAATAQRFAVLQEAKESAERAQLENIRLQKQLQLERSLKERYQHKYEEQNAMWSEQMHTLQEYILQVRATFGDARLPPLPSALLRAPAGSISSSHVLPLERPAFTEAKAASHKREAEAQALAASSSMKKGSKYSTGARSPASSLRPSASGEAELLQQHASVEQQGNGSTQHVHADSAASAAPQPAAEDGQPNGQASTQHQGQRQQAHGRSRDQTTTTSPPTPETLARLHEQTSPFRPPNPLHPDQVPQRQHRRRTGNSEHGSAHRSSDDSGTLLAMRSEEAAARYAREQQEAAASGVSGPLSANAMPGELRHHYQGPYYLPHQHSQHPHPHQHSHSRSASLHSAPHAPSTTSAQHEAATRQSSSSTQQQQQQQQQQHTPAHGGMQQHAGPKDKYVALMHRDLDNVAGVLSDDIAFIQEVHEGKVTARGMDANAELQRLKRKFHNWQKEFKDKLQTADEVFRSMDRIQRKKETEGEKKPGFMSKLFK